MTSRGVFEATRVYSWSPREMLKVPEEKADTYNLTLNNSLTATRRLFKRRETNLGTQQRNATVMWRPVRVEVNRMYMEEV